MRSDIDSILHNCGSVVAQALIVISNGVSFGRFSTKQEFTSAVEQLKTFFVSVSTSNAMTMYSYVVVPSNFSHSTLKLDSVLKITLRPSGAVHGFK